MTYTEIINDKGFEDWVDAMTGDDDEMGFFWYGILHKTREAINKEDDYLIDLKHYGVIRYAAINEDLDFDINFLKLKIPEIEALAQALYFIYKEQK